MNFRGKLAELLSSFFLFLKGYKILARNYRKKWGELDIVASKNKVLVFVEVKYRKTKDFGEAELFVDKRKQTKVIKTAKSYMFDKGINPEDTLYRFDIIGITGFKLKHIENAFN